MHKQKFYEDNIDRERLIGGSIYSHSPGILEKGAGLQYLQYLSCRAKGCLQYSIQGKGKNRTSRELNQRPTLYCGVSVTEPLIHGSNHSSFLLLCTGHAGWLPCCSRNPGPTFPTFCFISCHDAKSLYHGKLFTYT